MCFGNPYGEVWSLNILDYWISKLIDSGIKLISLSDVVIPTRLDPALLRPADVTLQVPCVDKFIHKTDWKPFYTFEESLGNLLSYWRIEADKIARLNSKD